MWDEDEFNNLWKKLQDIIDNNYTGAYMPNRRFGEWRNTEYGHEEKGVIYASRELEILDFDEYITITVEFKGVRDEDLEVEPEEQAVIISYMADGVWRKRPLKLPYRINPKTAKISFNNCILDIRLEKAIE